MENKSEPTSRDLAESIAVDKELTFSDKPLSIDELETLIDSGASITIEPDGEVHVKMRRLGDVFMLVTKMNGKLSVSYVISDSYEHAKQKLTLHYQDQGVTFEFVEPKDISVMKAIVMEVWG